MEEAANAEIAPAPRAPRRRRSRSGPLLILLAALLAWLAFSSSGLARLARIAEAATGGALQLEVEGGRLFGNIALRRLVWQDPGGRLELSGVRLAWHPSRLVAGTLAASSLAAERLVYRSLASSPASTPVSLTLPLKFEVADVRLGALELAGADGHTTLARQLAARRFSSDGQHHRLEGFSARLPLADGGAQAQGSAEVDGRAPFASRIQLALTGAAGEHPLQLDLEAAGPLGDLPVSGRLQVGPGRAELSARVRSFAGQPLAAADLTARTLDPAALWPGAPHAALDLELHLGAGPDGALAGKLELTNAAPAPADQGGLPPSRVEAAFHPADATLILDRLHLELPGGGRLEGQGRLAGTRLRLALQARALDARVLYSKVRATRLAGPLELDLAPDAQAVDARLTEAGLALAARLRQRAGSVHIDALDVVAGKARLQLNGNVAATGNRAFALNGMLQDFDPSRFASALPPARLSASLAAQGQLAPPLKADLRFALQGSRVADQPLSGKGQGVLEGESLRDLALDLALGPNRLQVHGGFGAPGRSLAFEIAAPKLDAGPLRGSLSGKGRVSGSLAAPELEADLSSPALQLPGELALRELALHARVPATANAPLALDLRLGRIGPSAGAPWIKDLKLGAEGSPAQHRIHLAAALPRPAAALALELAGGLAPDAHAPSWQGRLSALSLTPEGATAPLLRLAAPAALQLLAQSQSLTGAELQGRDWSLSLPRLARRDGVLQASGALHDFPLALLALPGIDGDLRLDGDWDLGWDGAPSGQFALRRKGGDLVLNQDSTRLALGLDTLSLSGRFAPGALALEAHAHGERLGQTEANLRLPLATDGSLRRDGPLAGSASLSLAQLDWLAPLLRPDLKFAGTLQARLSLAGTPARPTLSGTLNGEGLDLTLLSSGMRLSRGSLVATLEDSRITLDRLHFDALLAPLPEALAGLSAAQRQGLAGPGAVDASGHLDFLAESGELSLKLDRVGALQQARQWLALSGQTQLSLAQRRLKLRGELNVDAASWELAALGRPSLSDDVVIRRGPAPSSAARPLALDVDLQAGLGDYFRFAGAGLTARLAGSLRLQAQGLANLRATGTIRAEDGQFSAYGQALQVQRGLVNFQGLLDDPGLNIRAVRPGLAVEAGVEVSGTARAPVVRLVSSPEVPDADKLSWMLLGHGASQTTGGEQGLLIQAAGAILGQEHGVGGVVEGLKQTFGLDELGLAEGNIDGQGALPTSQVASARGYSSSAGAPAGQIVSLGKRLSKDLYLSFEQSLNATESVVKLTLQLTRHLAVVGRAGTDNAVDATYTLRFGK